MARVPNYATIMPHAANFDDRHGYSASSMIREKNQEKVSH